MSRQRKNFTVDKEKLKKVSVIEPVLGVEVNQAVVRPIHPVVNYSSLGPHGGSGKISIFQNIMAKAMTISLIGSTTRQKRY